MNLENIQANLQQADPEFAERTDTRRKALKDFAGFAGKVAITALPFAIGSFFKKAYAGPPPSSVIDVLNFALTLEYLEAEFYKAGIAKGSALIPSAAAMQAIKTIGTHEAQHVTFLRTAITSSGGTPIDLPKFDLSGGSGSGNGPFKDAFTNYQLFLAVAQTLEDTGVRAYKGQAGNLLGTGAVLTAALNIHSVEARHASHIRQMRQKAGFGDAKPWITTRQTGGIGSIVQANYNGEENTVQAGIEIKGINGQDITVSEASEGFDEPLTKEQVVALVTPFFAK
ncbi:ferritin-like domain-containing protein [Foetidibacter luteolus]|uniref:ferritin-like domain-containing protein n=1 Tax=Foetidibacter luteolus TaxID=2608880 RepID=UPI00129ACD81|nr:ferritin-like domain-containing protein [Foetidibacter luteolus]